MGDIKYPKIALGAWAWGNDGTFGGGIDAAEVELSNAEVKVLEGFAGSLQINAVCMWEKVMD